MRGWTWRQIIYWSSWGCPLLLGNKRTIPYIRTPRLQFEWRVAFFIIVLKKGCVLIHWVIHESSNNAHKHSYTPAHANTCVHPKLTPTISKTKLADIKIEEVIITYYIQYILLSTSTSSIIKDIAPLISKINRENINTRIESVWTDFVIRNLSQLKFVCHNICRRLWVFLAFVIWAKGKGSLFEFITKLVGG
jgi:hypothetical protein